MREFIIPQYLIEDEKLEEIEQTKTKSRYSQCKECQEYVHENDWPNHRKMYCDPGHLRKKQFVTRPMPRKLLGGFVLGYGVDPRPITDPPTQILRGRCRTCDAILALPEDIRCIGCEGVKTQ